jgi:hypothetical protein
MTHLQSILLFKDSSRQQKEGDAPFFGQIAGFVVSPAAQRPAEIDYMRIIHASPAIMVMQQTKAPARPSLNRSLQFG